MSVTVDNSLASLSELPVEEFSLSGDVALGFAAESSAGIESLEFAHGMTEIGASYSQGGDHCCSCCLVCCCCS